MEADSQCYSPSHDSDELEFNQTHESNNFFFLFLMSQPGAFVATKPHCFNVFPLNLVSLHGST